MIEIDAKKAAELCGSGNWRNGNVYALNGQVLNPWRREDSLFAEVKGSGTKPYQVSVVDKDGELKPRCTCPASKRQPFCKHVAAMLALWVSSPTSFIEGQGAPALADVTEVKRGRSGKAKAPGRNDLITSGLSTAENFLNDLVEQGLLSLSPQQVEGFEQVAVGLDGYKVPRLARQVLNLQKTLERSYKGGSFQIDPLVYTRSLSEIWLNCAAIRKTIADETLNPVVLDDLTGKTITEKSLEIKENLRLIELHYEALLDQDGFNIFNSFLVDITSGKLYNERSIVPTHLRDAPTKPSYDSVLQVARAGLYPGYAPRRVKLIEWETQGAPSLTDWQGVQKAALTSVADLFSLYQSQKADLLNTGRVLVLFSPQTILVTDDDERGFWLEDSDSQAIPVVGAPLLLTWLKQRPIAAFFGQLVLQSGQLCFEPLSFVMIDDKPGLVRLTS